METSLEEMHLKKYIEDTSMYLASDLITERIIYIILCMAVMNGSNQPVNIYIKTIVILNL